MERTSGVDIGGVDCRRRPRSAWGDSDAWDREYGETQSIPSSLRLEPSRAFRRLEHTIGDPTGLKVLDLGAGTGRHSLYLHALGAQVHAIDASDTACRLHRERAAGLSSSTLFIERGVVDEANLPDGRYDLIIDSYVSCHILSSVERHTFLDRLMSRLARGGSLYTAGMGSMDSYYRRHVVCDQDDTIAVDPLNGIAKLLQERDIATHDGMTLADVVASATQHFVEAVGGTAEFREVHAAVLTR